MKKNILLLVLVALTQVSCSKDEGYGGLATIEGKVFAKDYNSNGSLVGEGYLGGQKVYISEHNNPSQFDDVDTSYDGSFRFEFLQKGTYDIWTFGDCDSCNWDQNFVLKTVEIGSKKANVTVEDLIITF